MATGLDYYQILDLEDKKFGRPLDAAHIKHAYRRALLRHHPDKSKAPQRSTAAIATVDEITAAYRTLADPILREEYDTALKARLDVDQDGLRSVQTRHTGMETLDLEDLDMNDATGTWTRACRCGSQPAFVVTEPELETNAEYGELVTGCKGCSLWLKVLFSVAD